MSDTEGAQDHIQAGAEARVNDSGDVPWRTTVGYLGDTLVMTMRVRGDLRGMFSVAGDRGGRECYPDKRK